jgi:AraC family transcriptional regulator
MEKAIEQAVGRVIETMRDNIGEQLTVDDLARAAMFSKFHFSRVFQRVTGVSPGRFLSAMRLHEAKQLLVSTSLSVTDISHRVGYTSVGTFSSRFKRSVGVSPSIYRQLGGFTPAVVIQGQRRVAKPRAATVRGKVWAPHTDELGLIFVGLFADRIPQGQPVRCTVVHRPGQFILENVPQGTWYVLAHSSAAGLEAMRESAELDLGQALCAGSYGPFTIRAESVTEYADVRLRPVCDLDPDVLNALLDIRSVALSVGAA